MTRPGDPLIRHDDGSDITFWQARDAVSCLPDGLTLETSTVPQVRAAIAACKRRRAATRRQAQADARARERATWMVSGDRRNGPARGYTGDIASSRLPDQVKAAATEFERAVAAGEIRFGTFTADTRGDVTHQRAARVYTTEPHVTAARWAAIELCQKHSAHVRGVTCADT